MFLFFFFAYLHILICLISSLVLQCSIYPLLHNQEPDVMVLVALVNLAVNTPDWPEIAAVRALCPGENVFVSAVVFLPERICFQARRKTTRRARKAQCLSLIWDNCPDIERPCLSQEAYLEPTLRNLKVKCSCPCELQIVKQTMFFVNQCPLWIHISFIRWHLSHSDGQS